MRLVEYEAVPTYRKMGGAVGYAGHSRQVIFYRSALSPYVFVYGKGLYHYRSVHLPPHVSADLLKESNNKK